jgi:MoaA/NifB/PqqE/SkfB family radical SAM enzyme
MEHVRQHECLRLEGIHRDKVLIGPRRVTVKLTDQCNYRCVFCGLHRGQLRPIKRFYPMAFGKFRELVADLKFLKTEEIHLSGYGEPFVHPDIYRMIDVIHGFGLRSTVFTNGSFSLSRLDTVAKIDRMIINHSAATATVFKRIHSPRRETFAAKKKRIELLARLSRKYKKPGIRIVFTITPFNVSDMRGVFDFCAGLELDGLEFRLASDACAPEDLLFAEKERLFLRRTLREIVETRSFYLKKSNIPQLARAASIGGEPDIKQDLHSADFFKRGFRCYLGWFQCDINLYGNVSPCSLHESLCMGNIYQTPFRTIWEGKKTQGCLTYMKYHFDPKDGLWQKCRSCAQRNAGQNVFDMYESFRSQFHRRVIPDGKAGGRNAS